VYDLLERCETPPQWEFRDVSSPSVPAGPTTRDSSAPPSLLPFTASKIFSRRRDDRDVAERVRVRERQGIHDPPLHAAAWSRSRRPGGRADHLRGLPPMLVHGGAGDVLSEDAAALAAHARAAGMDATRRQVPEMVNVWHVFAGGTMRETHTQVVESVTSEADSLLYEHPRG